MQLKANGYYRIKKNKRNYENLLSNIDIDQC